MGKIAKQTAIVDTDMRLERVEVSKDRQGSYVNDPIPYDPSMAYLVPRIYACLKPSQDPSFADSKRFYAEEMKWNATAKKWVPTGNLTAIKVSAINQTYQAEVSADADMPRVAVDEDGRIIRGGAEGYDAPRVIRCCNGNRGFAFDSEEHLYMKRPMLFRPIKQVQVYTTRPMRQDDGSYKVAIDEENRTVAFQQQNVWLWETEPATVENCQAEYTIADIADGILSDDQLKLLTVD
jgi:hypothetical protein